jgi:hypothetical protein
MANISLEGSIRTCKVDTAWANKLESDRFFNPNVMLCPAWNGVDTSGRTVDPSSYRTTNAGCDSAGYRIGVENDLRPKYMEYINLDAEGIRGDQLCQQFGMNDIGSANAQCRQKDLESVHMKTGQFGLVSGFPEIRTNCVTCTDDAASKSLAERQGQGYYQNARSVSNSMASGMARPKQMGFFEAFRSTFF